MVCILSECSEETLTTDLLGFIRKEKPLDYSVPACHLLALIQLSIDFNRLWILKAWCLEDNLIYSISRSTLINLIRKSKFAKLQAEAVYSLGLMHFVCECDDEDTEEFITLLIELIHSHKVPTVTEAAILNWVLLMSISPTRTVLSESLPSYTSKWVII